MNIGNRPGWGGGWGGGGWGYGGGYGGWGYGGGHGHWGNYWNSNHIHHHHNNWYHGCWSGNWGSSWYVPLVYGATAWGVNAVLPSWGYNYGYSYSNPYYVSSAMPAYDYSQPIVINTYNTPTSDAYAEASPEQTATQDTAQTTQGYQLFDQARESFKQGNYDQALALDERAIQSVPDDPVLHEFGALCLFAQGNYDRAAAVLNALLAVAPGMDWATMSSLYPNVAPYTEQLRALEAHVKQKPDDVAARFVLAYHYLVAGHTDNAVTQLKEVVAKQPNDQVAQRMLESLQPPEPPAEEIPTPSAEAAVTDPVSEDATPEETTDLVGKWRADRNEDVFGLWITEDGKFTWKAIQKDTEPIEIEGQIATTSDTIVLESGDQGSMVARVKSDGADQFQFVIVGGPPNDEGLTFRRVKQE